MRLTYCEERRVEIMSDSPIAMSHNVFLVSKDGFFIKLEEEKRREENFGGLETVYFYTGRIIGTVRNGKLERAKETPEVEQKASLFDSDVFELVHEAGFLSPEEEIEILERIPEEDIENRNSVKLFEEDFERKEHDSEYSFKSVDIGTQDYSYIPSSLSIRKHHGTGKFEIFNYQNGEALWTGSLNKIIDLANTLAGYRDFARGHGTPERQTR